MLLLADNKFVADVMGPESRYSSYSGDPTDGKFAVVDPSDAEGRENSTS